MSSHHFIRRKLELKKQKTGNESAVNIEIKKRTSLKSEFDENGLVIEKKNDREGFLKIGDIISLQAKDEMKVKDIPTTYVGVIFGDGIAYVDLECIPRRLMFSKYQNIQFRQSLFRVEPAHQYGFSKYYQMLLNDSSATKEEIQIYKKKSEEEIISNEMELELSYGRTITYGERVQLRHLHSNFFLTTSVNIAKEYGSLKVILVEGGNEGSWIEILPSNKLRQEGEPIRYIDKFILSSRIEKSNYYMHMGISSIFNDDMISELNASGTKSLWKALKYISYTEIKKNPSFVSSGDSFRIYIQEHSGYLSVSSRDISDLLPPELDYGGNYHEEFDIECLVYLPKIDISLIEKHSKKLEVFVEKEKSGRSLWELERTYPFIGGIAMAHEFFRIKHVGTGMYLEISRIGNVSLKSDPTSIFNVFHFIRTENSSPQIHFNTQLRIQSKATSFFLGTADTEDLQNYASLDQQESSANIPIKSYKEDKNLINTTFVLIDVPESSTIHIYQLSRVILKVVDFYSFLNDWGMLKISELQWIPNYDLALNTELDLQIQVEKVLEIFLALNKKILKNDIHGHDNLLNIQEAIRETGLLDLLLKLSQLITRRLVIKKDTSSINTGREAYFIKGLVQKAVEGVKGPGCVAEKYLVGLIKKLYSTIYHCIKNNPKNCELLKNYDEFLSYQLAFYKSEVSLLLKETFKHSIDIMNKISIKQFGVWAEQITVINELKGDVVDQTLVLMILASFCVHKNKGIQKYQRLIESNLFSSISRIKLLEFITINEIECIGFLPGDFSMDFFLDNNPRLMSLYQKSLIHPVIDTRLIDIVTLNPHNHLINYVSAFLDLLINLCISRYESAKPKIQETFELTSHYVLSCLTNKKLHLKLRIRFMKLARVLYLDVNPIIPLTKTKDRCFFLNPDSMALENRINTTINSNIINFPLTELAEWLSSAWTHSKFPAENIESYSVQCRLKYVIELLHLTEAFLNLGYTDFEYFITIYPSLVKIIFDYSNDSIIKFSFDSHWCRTLKIEIMELPEEKVNLMILSVLKIFSIGNCMRKTREIESFLELYISFIKGETGDIIEITKKFEDISVNFDFSKALFNTTLSKTRKNFAGIAFLSALNKNTPLPFDSSIHQTEYYQLESCLLNLIFKNTKKSIEECALGLILDNFNHRRNFFNLLDEIHLCYNNNQDNIYLAMRYNIDSLSNLFSRLTTQNDISSLDGEMMEEGIELSYIEGLLFFFKQIKSLLLISQPKQHLLFAQGIARNLQYHKIILKFFLNYNLPWLTKMPKRIIISNKWEKKWKEVYKSLVHSLFSFSFKNRKNQLLLYPKISTIVQYFSNGIGTSALISQLLACQKDIIQVENLVNYVFYLLNRNEKIQDSPHDLKILLTLLVDEKKRMQPDIQVNVIKSLVSSPEILSYYTNHGIVDFSRYSEKNIKFHTTVVLTLAYCCMNNEFAIKQCKRILPYSLVLKELLDRKLNYSLKKAYLHYIGFVFMNSQFGEVNYEILAEVFSQVIIPDLINFRDYLEYIPILANKEAYKTINFRKEIRIEPQDAGFIVREYLDHDEIYAAENNSLNSDELEALAYWKYLISAKPWKVELVTGLLIFIHDLCIDMKIAEYEPSILMQSHLEKVMEIIIDIKDAVQDFSDNYPKLNFEFILDTISVSMSEIPTSFNLKANKNELDDECYRSIMNELGNLCKSFRLTAEKFVMNKLKISTSEVSINELAIRCKGILSENMEKSDIFRGLRVLGTSISVENLTEEIHKHARLNTFHRAYSICEKIEPIKESHFNSRMKKLLENINNNLEWDNSFELAALVNQVKKSVVDVALMNKDFSTFYKFTRNLELAFSNPQHKVYLIEIFRQMILIERKSELPNDQKKKRIQKIQQGLLSVNIGELCLSYLSNEFDSIIVSRALKLLHQMLEDSEISIKDSMLNDIKRLQIGLKFFTFIRTIMNQTIDEFFRKNFERSIKIDLCLDLFHLLKLFCSCCYSPFQQYLLEQVEFDQRISIDIVSEVVKFVSNLQGIKEIKIYEDKTSLAQQLMIEGFKVLRGLCQGPCEKIQTSISNHLQIYNTINWIAENFENEYKGKTSFFQLISSISLFLLSLLEGDTSELIAVNMLNSLKMNKILKIATVVYWKYIKNSTHKIQLERPEDWNSDNTMIINIGFNISMIFLKFQDRFPEDHRVKVIFQANSDEVHENIKDDEAYNYQEAIMQNLNTAWKKFKLCFFNQTQSQSEISKLKEAHFYYTSNIGSVEIQFKSNLCRLFFRIPPMCKFLTRKSRQDIILNVSRKSHQEKIEDFFNKSKIYEFEMEYQQSLYSYNFVDKIVSYWNFYGFLAFFSVIVINLTLLFSYDQTNYMNEIYGVTDFLIFCGIIQIISAALYLISYTIEYFPVIRHRGLYKNLYLDDDQLKQYGRVKGTLLMKTLINAGNQADKDSVSFGLRFILQDFQLLYCIIYFALSCICWYNFLLYSVLLLDLVKRNDMLINILKSISLNFKQILLTLLLGIFIIFIYSTIYMIAFSNQFQNNWDCDTLSVCFFTILDSGTRAGGGIGDLLSVYTDFSSVVDFRLFSDMSFFALVTFVLLNIIFGIIIDTFAELREKRTKLMKDLHDNCFICGNNRFLFEIKRISWNIHIHLHHSLHSYLAFLVYIRQKNEIECNGAEIYTKEKILNNDVAFFPRTSISLKTLEKELKDSQEKLCKKYVKKLNDLKDALQ